MGKVLQEHALRPLHGEASCRATPCLPGTVCDTYTLTPGRRTPSPAGPAGHGPPGGVAKLHFGAFGARSPLLAPHGTDLVHHGRGRLGRYFLRSAHSPPACVGQLAEHHGRPKLGHRNTGSTLTINNTWPPDTAPHAVHVELFVELLTSLTGRRPWSQNPSME